MCCFKLVLTELCFPLKSHHSVTVMCFQITCSWAEGAHFQSIRTWLTAEWGLLNLPTMGAQPCKLGINYSHIILHKSWHVSLLGNMPVPTYGSALRGGHYENGTDIELSVTLAKKVLFMHHYMLCGLMGWILMHSTGCNFKFQRSFCLCKCLMVWLRPFFKMILPTTLSPPSSFQNHYQRRDSTHFSH